MSPQPQNQLMRSAPYFPVSDVHRAAVYYERTLGFLPEYVTGAPPQFAIMTRDGFAIMLRLVAQTEQIVPNERQGGTWDVFFWVRDVRALYTEMSAKGADIVYEPIVQGGYQMEEFAVRDCDGYVLGFGQAMARD